MNTQQIAGIIRHVATLIGGVLIAFGWLSEDTLTQLTEALVMVSGGIISLVGIIASFRAPEKKVK